MSYNALMDLNLAGVRWELTDTPNLVGQNRAPAQSPTAPAPLAGGDISRTSAAVVPPIAPVATVSLDTVRAMASRPNDMSALNRMIGEFNHPLRTAATNTTLPFVAPNPNGMVILTDIPSSDDDATGKILSGASGELMDKMLAAIGMSRENVSIVPMLFWRTPGGRTPSRAELDMARPFVDRALELLNPRVVLTLGTLPATEIAGINLAKAHGTPITQENGRIIMPIFHPNYLILKPTAKREVWTALQNVQNILKNA